MNCYLGIGSNLDDKKRNLRQSIELISQIDGVNLIAVSHFYETAPWGVIDQPTFINAAVRVESTLEPLKLLEELQTIENKLGRVRSVHWGARTIDIDILYIDGFTIDNERLKVPHPFMFERDFVLVPLSEISNIRGNLHGDKVVKTYGCLVDFNLKIIACVDKNFGLGRDGKLLFHIAEDLKRFRAMTLGNTVIMGRKTFESIGRPLDNRRNIVLSRSINNIAMSHSTNIEGVFTADSLQSLYALLSAEDKNFVIGGGEIYRQLIPFISEAYITVVDESKISDTFLTNFDERDDFICDSRENRVGFVFRHYIRA